MKYYLRVEGVNLSSFVFDTHDLSTIRGGSFLLLHAIEQVAQRKTAVSLEPISTGASAGLFSFNVADDGAAEGVRQDVETYLNTDDRLRYATFVVDVQPVPVGDDFVRNHDAVLTRNRWRQMQQLSVAVPAWNDQHDNVCQIDRMRPAVTTRPGPRAGEEKQEEYVSASVKARSTWGREEKQRFYAEELQKIGEAFEGDFVHDLDKLSADSEKGKLHHKMALIYLDGNSFGKLRRKKCRTQEKEREFDTTIKTYRRRALKALLDTMSPDPAWKADDHYQIETLMWGGDELLWIVPAWQGWKTLQLFYQQSRAWVFDGEPLTHAGGMVFCHYKAPIHRLTALAKDLAEIAKKKDRTTNGFVYQVLESFDHIGRGLEEFLEERYGVAHEAVLSSLQMDALAKARGALGHDFPRSKLIEIAQCFQDNRGEEAQDLLDTTTRRFECLTREAWEKLEEYFCQRTACIHLAELWDYLGTKAIEGTPDA